jgi:hypothetical protein
MPGEHRLGGALHLLRVPLEVGARAAAMFRGVARQLHPIDRKHLASDEPLSITDREHGRKNGRDRIAQGADELRDGGEVRPRVPAEGNERHLLLARPRDGPRDAGVMPHVRLRDAVALVEARRDAQGRWPLGIVHDGEVMAEPGVSEGAPSASNTLRGVRVLQWVGALFAS